jgi:hypothetical protein
MALWTEAVAIATGLSPAEAVGPAPPPAPPPAPRGSRC